MTPAGAGKAPRTRSRTLRARQAGIFVLLAIVGAGFPGCFPKPSLRVNVPQTVRYEVGGNSGVATFVRYSTKDGQKQETNLTLPWSKEFTTEEGLLSLLLKAQNARLGSISCRILIDGKVVSENTSTGQDAVVSCSGS